MLYLISLVGLCACTSGVRTGRYPDSLPLQEEGCAEVATDLIIAPGRLSLPERARLLESAEAKEIDALPEVKAYFEYVSDPEERADFLALGAKIRTEESELSGAELLARMNEVSRGPCP